MKRENRTRLFWGVCVPVRTLVAAAALFTTYRVEHGTLLVGLYAGGTALGFLTSAALELSGRKTTGGFGGEVWWKGARVVHIANWAACAAMCFAGWRSGAMLLAADVLVGAVAGALYHSRAQ